ncbi:TPA: type III toxin-antitoxin system ToxN/AbiQ family toxin [Streptococcus suis]|uniref:type III toxin-antitoxin system ToxN/AbiQ family toxin n=1 Tax=Streptococcus suis TaxID=1307 RepID=UPI000941F9C0|nr:type III toxin-antitoxin system ToxN/AbiQ family toxin [Streptococcus suis]HEL2140657.1 type III toxin-antitoxin system ToxN/AbiQ family toxin [Streptococcus suis]HEL2140820.1 type III toxin-antitoxin system ToxN/AbiQ family toxin [Streptococcus suis]
MNQISFHYISDEYIDYLRKIDPRVRENKQETRPYVVLGIIINNFEYYIPLSSPKFLVSDDGTKKLKKPKLYKNLYYIMERENQDNQTEYLGTLLFNNMITAPLTEVNYIEIHELFKTNPDYAVLLTKQIDIIKQNFNDIEKQAELVYKMNSAIKGLTNLNYVQDRILKECCDFQSIEIARTNFETRKR